MDPRGTGWTKNAYCSLLTHTKQLLLLTFCQTTARNGASFRTHRGNDGMTDGQTDVEVEIVIQMKVKMTISKVILLITYKAVALHG